ncbi:MAG: type I restriction-modification system subunit M [Methanosphaera sp.]|nr:type I restriction-modification system subunit M [Methanosphaera sp.]
MENIKDILIYTSQKLQGHMKFEDYRHYILSAVFYKYLSEKIEKENNKKLFKYNINFEESFNDENIQYYGVKIKEENLENLGFFIKPENLYDNILKRTDKIRSLNNAICEIEFESKKLKGIFDIKSYERIFLSQNTIKILEECLININNVSFDDDEDVANYLMKYFLKKSFTPTQISTLLSKLVTIDRDKITNAYDAACGSCSTLLAINDEADVTNFYGQEIKEHTSNMAKINMIMHEINAKNFHIYNEDSTIIKRSLPKMDVIVSHPPFLKKWNAKENLIEDERFNCFKKLPPKSRADYAFIESMVYQLNDDGIMAVVMPQGVLFRSNAEEAIRRTFLKEKNYIDTIIGLPDKTFHKNIPTCILILKKNRKKDDTILFIDASTSYIKNGKLNILSNEDIDKIVNAYKNKCDIDQYSSNVSIAHIKENNYNLNIKLYIDTFVEKDKINIKESLEEIKKLDEKEKELINMITKDN